MTRPLVIYHANCADGFAAAWVAHRHLGDGADYQPANYGEPPPDVTGRDVYVLDFSYKRPVMLEVVEKAKSVVVLDHHKTAKAELEGLPCATFDMEKSGGRLAWEHFFPGKVSPWLVDYTEDRDLWRWKLPHSREISAAIASHPYDFDLWDRWAMNVNGGNATPTLLAEEGRAILRYQSQQVESQVKNATEVELAGHKVLAVNATHLTSEIAGKLAEGKPFGACYFIRGDGKKVWSLRSRDGGIDVSEIAKAKGGGGHRNAAGFEE